MTVFDESNSYWKIVDGHIVAVQGMTFRDIQIQPGDVGACISSMTKLPSQGEALWISAGTKIEDELYERVRIGAGVFVGPDCIIRSGVELGEGCHISEGTSINGHTEIGSNVFVNFRVTIGSVCVISSHAVIGYECVIGDLTRVGRNTKIGAFSHVHGHIEEQVCVGDSCNIQPNATIEENVYIGDDVRIGHHSRIGRRTHVNRNCTIGNSVSIDDNLTITSGSNLFVGKFMQIHNVGTHQRNLIIYPDKYNEVVISIGCQHGITLKQLKYRLKKGYGTTDESAGIYKQQIQVFESAVRAVERANNISAFTSIVNRLFGDVK